MNIDTLYKYLKLVIPSDLYVTRKEDDSINVSASSNRGRYESVFADTYTIQNDFIVLSRFGNTIPEYAKKIFGNPALINQGYLATYTFFNIPKELRDLNESTKS